MARVPSVAVLPFTNLASENENPLFAIALDELEPFPTIRVDANRQWRTGEPSGAQ